VLWRFCKRPLINSEITPQSHTNPTPHDPFFSTLSGGSDRRETHSVCRRGARRGGRRGRTRGRIQGLKNLRPPMFNFVASDQARRPPAMVHRYCSSPTYLTRWVASQPFRTCSNSGWGCCSRPPYTPCLLNWSTEGGNNTSTIPSRRTTIS
jgi:hypothetical protein